MTRAHIASDLHADMLHNGYKPNVPDCDVVIIAGDAHPPLSLALPWMRKAYPDHPVIYVPGNHCYYSDASRPETKTTYEREREIAPRIAEQHDITLLDNSGCIIDGTRILGSTMWTGFDCRPSYMSFDDAVRGAMRMNDYRLIKTGAGRGKDRLKPRDTIEAHKTAVRWLTSQLLIPHDGETVIVTDHAPSAKSLIGRGEVSYDLDWCYASSLEWMMNGEFLRPDGTPMATPDLWIHGHIHSNRDYTIGKTRVICNPRGYPKYFMPNAPRENPDFDPDLVIDVGRDLMPSWRM
jgi:predicted phosphodiesterase